MVMNKLLLILGLALLLSACSTTRNGSLTVEEHFDRGRERLRARDYNGAIAHFDRVILFQPKHPRVHLERAKARYARKNLDGAADDLTAAIGINPALTEAYALRGKILLENKDAQAAIGDFNKAIELNPNLKSELTPLLETAREMAGKKP